MQGDGYSPSIPVDETTADNVSSAVRYQLSAVIFGREYSILLIARPGLEWHISLRGMRSVSFLGCSMPVRIMVADDHEVVRRGLRDLLESNSDWQVTAEAENGLEVVQKAAELKPDVIVLDITMPGLNGLEAARRIRKTLPEVEVLFLTVHDSAQMIHEALNAGARGYVLKSDAGRDLLAAIESVRRHRFFFSLRVTQTLGSGAVTSALTAPKNPRSALTSREREILTLLAEGKTTKESAVVLKIAVKTAETHRTNIMRKLDLHSLSDLVRYAIRNGIVEP